MEDRRYEDGLVEEGKQPYEAPQITSYSDETILEELGPAQAWYSTGSPN